MGIGLLLIGNDNRIAPLLAGGTGRMSAHAEMPDFYPDRLEAGTQNIAGIRGLKAGVDFVMSHGIERIYQKENRLIEEMYRSLKHYNKLNIIGREDDREGVYAPVLAFTVDGTDSESVAVKLSEQFNIAVRGGLHCAPLAHKALHTIDSGVVRVSPSVFTSADETAYLQRVLSRM